MCGDQNNTDDPGNGISKYVTEEDAHGCTLVYTVCLALLTIAFASGGASAQLLEKKTLSLTVAKKMAVVAEAEASKNKWAMVIAVLDDGGHLIYLEHMDGAQIGSIEVAQGKARTAVRFRRPSKDFEDAVAASHLNVITLGDITAIRGGLPVMLEAKRLARSASAAAPENKTSNAPKQGWRRSTSVDRHGPAAFWGGLAKKMKRKTPHDKSSKWASRSNSMILRVVLISTFVLAEGATAYAATARATINSIDVNGVGPVIGTVTFKDTKYGLVVTPDISDLPVGVHGFHIHDKGACGLAEHEGKMAVGFAAGGHYDPEHTGKHLGPYNTGGHKGDLPVLVVGADGEATLPVLAPQLRVKDVRGRSLIIHAGEDNYSDQPNPLGGGGTRIACGVIK